MTTYSAVTGNVVSPTLTTSGNNRTFSLTPTKVGNLLFMVVAWQASTTNITSVASSNASWGTVAAKASGSVGGGTWAFQAFAGVASATSAQTVTISDSANPTAMQVDYMEFTADWLGKNPANWFFSASSFNFAATSTTVNWPSLTGFAIDEMFIGYGFMGGGLFTGTNGTPAGFTYNGNSGGNQNPFAWNLAYGKGPSIPTGTQAASGTYLTLSTVFQLYPSWIPASVNGNVV